MFRWREIILQNCNVRPETNLVIYIHDIIVLRNTQPFQILVGLSTLLATIGAVLPVT